VKCVWCLLLLLPFISQAQYVELKDGRLIKGAVSWDNSRIKCEGKTFTLNDISSFETGRPLASGEGEYLQLINGSLIKARSMKLDSKKAAAEFEIGLEEKTVPLNLVKAISFNGCRFAESGKTGFILKSGQIFEGSPSYFTRTLVGRSVPSKMRFKKEALSHIVFKGKSTANCEIRIYTTSKEIFCGSSAVIADGAVKLKFPLGEKSIPLDQVARCERRKGVQNLTSGDLMSVSKQAWLGMVKEPGFNQSFTGGTVYFNGFPLENFLAMHSRTEMKLKASKGWFRARAFIDPAVINGDLVLKIVQNGKEVFKERVKSGGDHVNINVKIAAGNFSVIADYGERGSSGDFLILANPRFAVGN
jgi:hypothetical protein